MSDRISRQDELDQFRQQAHLAVDWIADYLGQIESHPVLSQAKPGQVRSRLPEHPPADGEDFRAMLKDLDEIILPGITHWQSPNFFAYFPCNASPPAILGELISAGLGVQGMMWATSPACTELETHVLDWLADMLGLPDTFSSHGRGGGMIQSSASDATLCALLAAREQISQGRTNRRGCDGSLVAYASAQAHSSLEKNCRIAGIGADNLRLIETDENFAMRPDALAAQIDTDLAAGLTPFLVMACVGTTSSLAMDPLRPIGQICQRHGLWLHVDAAMAGTAAICPEFRAMHDGVELANSYVFNPHKWMFTNFDCTAFFVADRARLTGALGILPEYLKNQASADGQVIDYRDWQVPLGRRFRALKLWFVIRSYGVNGLQSRIREHVRLAQQLKAWVIESADFELAVDSALNLICFRHVAGDQASEELMRRVNDSGKLYLTHTRLDGRFTLRMSIGQTWTTAQHVEQAWRLLADQARGLGR